MWLIDDSNDLFYFSQKKNYGGYQSGSRRRKKVLETILKRFELIFESQQGLIMSVLRTTFIFFYLAVLYM